VEGREERRDTWWKGGRKIRVGLTVREY